MPDMDPHGPNVRAHTTSVKIAFDDPDRDLFVGLLYPIVLNLSAQVNLGASRELYHQQRKGSSVGAGIGESTRIIPRCPLFLAIDLVLPKIKSADVCWEHRTVLKIPLVIISPTASLSGSTNKRTRCRRRLEQKIDIVILLVAR